MGQSDFVFGPFHFDPLQMLLWRGDELVPLGHRAALLLDILLRRRGQIVRKDDLVDAAWPVQAVEESNLSVQIAALRRLVGAHWILTVERLGYQFLAAQPVPSHHPDPRGAFPSIAMLSSEPVENPSARDLLNGLATALARQKSMRLMALSYPEVMAVPMRRAACELGADYLVVLAPRWIDGVAAGAMARLVDGQSGTVLWAREFDTLSGHPADERMAAEIDSEVQAAEFMRGPRDDTAGAEAYGLYLRGRRALLSSRADDNRLAFGLFTAALALEPENPAYVAAASETMHHRLSVGWEALGADDKQVGRELARRAHAMAGSDAVALALAGNTYFTVDEEDLGLALCRRALEMNSTNHLVLACALHAEVYGGSLDAHERISRRAVELSPNDPGQRFAANGMAAAARRRGDHETALQWARRSLAIGPGFSGAHWSTIDALVRLGRRDQAERHLGRYLAISPGVTIASIERGQHHADRRRITPLIQSLRSAGMPER